MCSISQIWRSDKVLFVLYVGDTKVKVAYTSNNYRYLDLLRLYAPDKYIIVIITSIVKREPSSALLDASMSSSDGSITEQIELRFVDV